MLAETGHLERAARLFVAVDRLQKRFGIAVRPSSWHDYKRVQEQARQRMGEVAARSAEEAGLAMALDEAIAEAIAALESVTAQREGLPVTPPAGPAILSPRERDVLRLIADGRSNQQIADALSISRRTVTTHATNILNKLGLDSRAELIAFANRNGLV